MWWKGRSLQYSIDEFSRLLLGTGFILVTVLAVILGPAYPFWIVPALVILFTLGTGCPGGGCQILLTQTKQTSSTAVALSQSKLSHAHTLSHSDPASHAHIRKEGEGNSRQYVGDAALRNRGNLSGLTKSG